MGCTSSSEVVTDPVTGKTKTKNKLGGAYPGNRRQGNKPYQPPASAFSNGQATAHFVNYGGGNALVLKQDSGVAQPQMGATPVNPPQYIQVTLPAGVHAGQTIRVAAPDGRQNEIVVPDGFGPGMSFTVEFADGPPPVSSYNANKVPDKQQPTYASSYGNSYGNNTGAAATTGPTTTYTPGYTPNLTPY
ncbi:MAG: hypothetical protein SGILL_005250, partial [Bacillariaceae sp.]